MAAEESTGKVKIAEVTPESRAGWHAFADRYGCTVTALVEVFGLRFADLGTGELDDLPPKLRSCVKEAREVAAGRRRRA